MNYISLIIFLITALSGNAQSDTTPLYGYVDSVTFKEAEITPAFPGGPFVWKSYLSKNLRYPKVAEDQGIQGTVVVEFIVHTDGSVSDITVIKPVEKSLDKEAARLIAHSMWVPAIQFGKSVRYRERKKIEFHLE